jgi:hypothetical protein
MPLVVADRVQQTGTANTTVSFTLSGSVTGFQSFAVIGNTNTTYYAATDGSGNWEVGVGTYSTTGPTLTRTTILSSSNSGSAVTFSGTVNVFVTYPSADAVYDGGPLGTPSSGTVTNLTGTASININGTVGATTANSGAFTTLSATGVTTVQAGTVSAPAITTSGDTNTGIFFPAADTIAFTEGGVEVGRFDSSANFQFNSGYGSVATVYGCRAWVNFNGTTASNLSGTYSQTTTVVTVTATAHGLITGNSVYLDFTTGTAVDGTYTVTVTDANTFTVTQASRTTSGNVTLVRNTIRASGGVSSVADNGTGDYTINFSTAMPDVDYCPVFGGQTNSTGRGGVLVGENITNVSKTTTQLRILASALSTDNSPATPSDPSVANVAIFR